MSLFSSFSGVIHAYADNFTVYEEVLREWLTDQETSFAFRGSVEDVLAEVAAGRLFGLIVVLEGTVRGIALYEVVELHNKLQGIALHFLSCKNFYSMRKFYEGFEDWAIESGYSFVEARAHPTLARYAVENLGYAAPDIYICKTLTHQRIH